MQKIETKDAPQAIGPYSQAIIAGDFLFISGQLPIDPKTGKLIGEDILSQTKQVIENIEAILKSAHLNLSHVAKTEVYLKDLTEFQEMNEIYAKKFSHPIKPARVTIQAARLPLDAKIEISCIVYIC